MFRNSSENSSSIISENAINTPNQTSIIVEPKKPSANQYAVITFYVILCGGLLLCIARCACYINWKKFYARCQQRTCKVSNLPVINMEKTRAEMHNEGLCMPVDVPPPILKSANGNGTTNQKKKVAVKWSDAEFESQSGESET